MSCRALQMVRNQFWSDHAHEREKEWRKSPPYIVCLGCDAGTERLRSLQWFWQHNLSLLILDFHRLLVLSVECLFPHFLRAPYSIWSHIGFPVYGAPYRIRFHIRFPLHLQDPDLGLIVSHDTLFLSSSPSHSPSCLFLSRSLSCLLLLSLIHMSPSKESKQQFQSIKIMSSPPLIFSSNRVGNQQGVICRGYAPKTRGHGNAD